MFSLLFHSDVFVPKGVQEVVGQLQFHMKGYFLSQHLEEHLNNQATEDRSHTYFRNYVINTLNEMINGSGAIRHAFEIELSKDYHFFGLSGWFVTKYCIRIPYDSKCDLVIVIRPQWDKDKKQYDVTKNMVVTAWLNHKKDNHYTLDESKYCTESRWNSCN